MASNLANPAIRHVFVLMLENRSFDHMLGAPTLSPGYQNSFEGTVYPASTPAPFVMPFDPGHEFPDVVQQLCGSSATYAGGAYPPINNSGFVASYANTKSSSADGGDTGAGDYGEIMQCYAVAQLPVMHALARQFAVCDAWFASLPGPTWPNRFFVHAASSGGLDHSPGLTEVAEWSTIDGFSFPNGTIYDLMNKHGVSWRIYRGIRDPLLGSLPNVAALKGIRLSECHPYENFATDIGGNYTSGYTFIEPNYGDIVNNSYSGGQSQHPMDDVRHGEALIKSVYEAIRNSPLWPNSLLIITYDEHGGFYDHVAPPTAIAPGDTSPGSPYNQYGFTFEQYGVRVPALVISAYTPAGAISHETYDHSSVPATLEAIFSMPPLTKRDAQASNLTSMAALPVARTDTPERLPELATDMPAAVARVSPAAMDMGAAASEETRPVEAGNLAGFLHIALKGQMEGEEKNAVIDRFNAQVKTRGDARKFLETVLPGLTK